MYRRFLTTLAIISLILYTGCSQTRPIKTVDSILPEDIKEGEEAKIILKDRTTAEGTIISSNEDEITLKIVYQDYEKGGKRAKFISYRWDEIARVESNSQEEKTRSSLRVAAIMTGIVIGTGFLLLGLITDALSN